MSTLSFREADLDFWREFIEMYKNMPSLWKVASDEYKNKRLKHECYEKLTEKLKEIEPSASVGLTKRKINTFRSNFRREVNKILNSKLKGGPPYNPSVWYYKHMEFLYEDETTQNLDEPIMDDFDESMDVKALHITDEIYSEENPTTVYSYGTVIPPQKRLKRSHHTPEVPDDRYRNDLLDLACDKLRESCCENEIIAKYWANELKYLEPEQKLYAQKAINDILFEARMKTLSRDSVQINRIDSNDFV